MIGSLTALLQALRRALRDEVMPDVGSNHAQTQVAAVIDILGKLEAMTVWSPDALQQRLEFLHAGCEAFAAHLEHNALVLTLPAWRPAAAAGHEAAIADAEAHLRSLIDWLFARWDTLPPQTAAALDAIVRSALRQGLLVERKLIPLTDFSGMSALAPALRD